MNLLSKTLAICAALLLSAASAYAAEASDVGAAEVKLLVNIFTGNIGLVIGLIVTIMGVFMFIKGDSGGAVYVVVLGVLITMLPGIYNGLRIILCPIAESLGGQCGGG